MKKIILCFLVITLLLSACCVGGGETTSGSSHKRPSQGSWRPNPSETTVPTEETEIPQPTEDIALTAYSMLRFLSASNYSEPGTTSGETEPGALLPVADIPQPEQQCVKTLVELAFEATQQNLAVHYMRNIETKQECLAVILWTNKTRFPLMLLLKTDFGNANILLEHMIVGTTFQAEILAMVNIDPTESMYASVAAQTQYHTVKEEIVNVAEPEDLNGTAYIATYSGGTLHMKGIHGENASANLRESLNVFWQIYRRFELTDLLPIEQPENV